MRFTVSFCREQEAVQRAKATTAPLENCRQIALNAAKAWASEAMAAEARDAKLAKADICDADAVQEFAKEAGPASIR